MLRIHSSKIFWKLTAFRFWLGINIQKSKTLFPLLKVKKSTFFWKFIKTKSNDTILVAMEIILPNLRSLKHENEYEMKIVTRTPSSGISSPNFHNRLHWGHSSWNWHKIIQFWLAFACKLTKCVVHKNASTLDIAMAIKGGRRRLKINFFSVNSLLSGSFLSNFLLWSGCQFFYLCRCWKRREFDQFFLFWKLVHLNFQKVSSP